MKRGDRQRTGTWLFRLALGAFPSEFRDRFGPDMEADFVEQRREARRRGRIPAFRTSVRSAGGTFVAGLRERFRPAARTRSVSPDSFDRRGGAHPMDLFSQDLRFALRSLIRRPGFTIVATLTLALGIGANTAIFSVIDGVLLEPLEYNDPDGLLVLWQHDADRPNSRGVLSQPTIEDIAQLDVLASMVGYRSGTSTLTGMGEAELVPIGRVTDGLMETFQVQPALGRDIRAEENSPEAPYVAVIGYGFWQERFGGDPGVIGQTLEIRGETHEIVGIAPAGFDFPEGAQVWYAWRMDPEGCGRGCNTLHAIGRLAPTSTLSQARAAMSAVGPRLQQDWPEDYHNQHFRVLPLVEDLTGDVRGGLWMMLGAVGVVLLIACANVANLLLVRGASRKGEVAVRAALGASRRRLASQVMLESMILAALGGAIGLGLAAGAIALLQQVSPGTVPRIDQVGLDGTVLLFTGAAVLIVALIFGFSPAFHISRTPVAGVLARSGGRGQGKGGDARARSMLLAAEVGLSVVLLVGAGLLLRTFAQIHSVELGYETEEILRFTLVLPQSEYGELEQIAGFYQELERGIAAIPGVAAVGSSFGPPLGRGNITGQLLLDGRAEPQPGEETYGSLKPVSAGYLDAMGIPVVRGRGIETTDREGTLAVAVVNETLVRQNYPDEEAIGQRLEVTADLGYGGPVYTIVGVVPDIRSRSITGAPNPEIYVAHAQIGAGFQTVTVRGAGGVTGLVGQIRELVRTMDPNLPMRGVETMTEAVRRQAAPTRFYLLLIGVFAGLALLLAAVGLYGVVSYLVSQRTREIGVRMALGAGRPGIMRLVVLEGLRPALWGLAIGVLISLAGARVVEGLLFGVAPRDPLVFAGVPLLLAGVVVTASILPARRASRVDPVTALRAE